MTIQPCCNDRLRRQGLALGLGRDKRFTQGYHKRHRAQSASAPWVDSWALTSCADFSKVGEEIGESRGGCFSNGAAVLAGYDALMPTPATRPESYPTIAQRYAATARGVAAISSARRLRFRALACQRELELRAMRPTQSLAPKSQKCASGA
jgi:hypothetical protein